jgi:hypothetical protein
VPNPLKISDRQAHTPNRKSLTFSISDIVRLMSVYYKQQAPRAAHSS